jgi:fibro-slime domain-containing protein
MHARTVTTITTYCLLALAGAASVSLPRTLSIPSAWGEPLEAPNTITVRGIARDFPADHPDFNVPPSYGYGHVSGNIATTLDEDGKPVFVGGGHRVSREWRDSASRQICWAVYDEDLDDNEGDFQAQVDSGAITSAETFAQWYRDVPGVNQSAVVDVTMTRGADGIYRYATNDFFPVDGTLLDDGGKDHNYCFTFELVADFVYEADKNQMLQFLGDDDIWVFIDGKLVIDLNGIACNSNQFVDLNRLGLTDGQSYKMHFFHAERNEPKSQWRFATNILLGTDNILPSISMQFD